MAETMRHELPSDPAPPEPHGLSNPIPPSLLLHLLRSGALSKLATSPYDDNETDTKDNDDGENSSNTGEGEVSKRVFCNGFTGCGGRHRDRSRRQEVSMLYGKRLIPVLVKRPFCNSFGCYNGKRSSGASTGFRYPAGSSPSIRARMLAETLAAAEGASEPAVTAGKRLFCNGYGGCRGGKRSLYSNWLSKMNRIAAGAR